MAEERAVYNITMKILANFIGGHLQSPINGRYLDVTEPATGQCYAQLPNSCEQDVEKAISAAAAAFPEWSSCGVEKRSALLLKLAELIELHAEELALAESKDSGKPLWLAKAMDIPRAAQNFSFYASAILHQQSEAHYTEPVAINYTMRQPLGVVACISPWNLPLYLFSWKIAPALAAGNTVVAKPSEITPFTAFLLSELCIKAGFPPGVLNIVHGLGTTTGEAIVNHPKIKAISFTGGTETGAKIASLAAPRFIKMSLELGGKNPNIIFNSANLLDAAKTSVRAAFTNQGQICLCGSRIFVQRESYDSFKEMFLAEVQKLTVADPLFAEAKVGAVVSAQHKQKVLDYIQLAKLEGGNLLAGGHEVKMQGRCESGFFIAPTVIENLPFNCRTNTEEIFGPVVTLHPFDTEEEVLEMANATPYGLAAIVWTSNLQQAHRVSHKLQAGIVWVNCWLLRDLRTPFGGVKQSGIGREGGWEALRFFTEPKNICIKL